MYNSLKFSKSLYLKSHSLNPINWYEWKEDILKKAIDEDKMIFLSIGYYSCYWCHVMEQEVFNDKNIAELLNKYFISIKVDKEEMPEIDSYYINCMYLINGYAGYPANFILTPSLKPFLAFTYLPKNQFENLIINAIDLFYSQRQKVYDIADEIVNNISLFFNSKFKTTNLNKQEIESNLEKIDKIFYSNLDIYGGFNDKPKFPPHQILEYLLTRFEKVKSKNIYTMFSLTLDKMMVGGIYDHIDFGFYRYSVDNTWTVPHFEKMLYDNSYLLFLYTKAFALTNNWYYFNVFTEIWEFLKREFLIINNPYESAFISSTSAISYIDKDKFEEGAYYLFNYNEIKSILSSDEISFFKQYYDIETENFYNFHTKYKGTIITKINFEDNYYTYLKLNQIKTKLREYRKSRYQLLKDTKIITSWNLILSLYLIRSYKELNDYLIYSEFIDNELNNNNQLNNTIKEIANKIKEEFKNYSLKIITFILNNLFKDNKLYHVYYDNEVKESNYILLEDYALLLLNLIEIKRILKDHEALKKIKNLENLGNIDLLIIKFKNDILNYFYKNKTLYDNFYFDNLNRNYNNSTNLEALKLINSCTFLDSSISSNLSFFLNSFYYLDKKIFLEVLSNYIELINLYPLSCGSLLYNILLFLFDYNMNYNYRLINNLLFVDNPNYEIKNIKVLKFSLDYKKLSKNCYHIDFNKEKIIKELNLKDENKISLNFDICNDRECYYSKILIYS
jgi:uncharacterized protein YyaL (SSP411 family)